jgi:hypothetical protein
VNKNEMLQSLATGNLSVTNMLTTTMKCKKYEHCYNLTNMPHVSMRALSSGMCSCAERQKITDIAEPAASNF